MAPVSPCWCVSALVAITPARSGVLLPAHCRPPLCGCWVQVCELNSGDSLLSWCFERMGMMSSSIDGSMRPSIETLFLKSQTSHAPAARWNTELWARLSGRWHLVRCWSLESGGIRGPGAMPMPEGARCFFGRKNRDPSGQLRPGTRLRGMEEKARLRIAPANKPSAATSSPP